MMRILLILSLIFQVAVAGNFIPKIDESARVKQHRVGANGDLVEGEEEMRKIIIQWEAIPGALEYQVCHNCQLSAEDEVGEGDIHDVPITQTRSGRPMYVKYDSNFGINTFHVRASVEKGKWEAWSEPRNFNVQEPGNADHEEL